ncbi:hypothetical protein Csa_011417 [Cucumis sativus]|uniref:Uncharacterized protein n=1 Tax=Cucumis sativus TaxID=3659 RepID=A0A0A0L6A7_CUCSA|nr:hypothetical protein Csa_011417 [Cucumis sativus]
MVSFGPQWECNSWMAACKSKHLEISVDFYGPYPQGQAGVIVPYNWTDPDPKYYLLFSNGDLQTPSLILSSLIGYDEQGEEGDGLSSLDLFSDPI